MTPTFIRNSAAHSAVGIWSAPAYFNGAIYYGPNGGKLRMFQITNAKLGTAPSSTSPATFGYPGTTPSITSNGNSNGIVWALQSASSIGVLHAYDATNLATELYNSNQAANGRDQYSTNSNDKFITPMIANGKVYVETRRAPWLSSACCRKREIQKGSLWKESSRDYSAP